MIFAGDTLRAREEHKTDIWQYYRVMADSIPPVYYCQIKGCHYRTDDPRTLVGHLMGAHYELFGIKPNPLAARYLIATHRRDYFTAIGREDMAEQFMGGEEQ